MGIEPTNVGTTIRCVNHFATTAIINLAGVVGIEPTPKVLETFVLPLNYTPINGGGGRIRTAEPEGTDLQSVAFSHFATPPTKRWLRTESNRRHMDFQSIALPTELLSHKNILCKQAIFKNKMAVRTGLEPATSCVTGRHSNQLNYRTKLRGQDLNLRPPGYEPDELPDCSTPR